MWHVMMSYTHLKCDRDNVWFGWNKYYLYTRAQHHNFHPMGDFSVFGRTSAHDALNQDYW